MNHLPYNWTIYFCCNCAYFFFFWRTMSPNHPLKQTRDIVKLTKCEITIEFNQFSSHSGFPYQGIFLNVGGKKCFSTASWNRSPCSGLLENKWPEQLTTNVCQASSGPAAERSALDALSLLILKQPKEADTVISTNTQKKKLMFRKVT